METTHRGLVESITQRLAAYEQDGAPGHVLSDAALAESDELVLLADNPQDETSEEELDAFLEALNLVAWFHWVRFLASGESDRRELSAAVPLFALLHQLDPDTVPSDLAVLYADVEAELTLRPMNALWEESATDLIERSIAMGDLNGADEAVYLIERALAGLPAEHEDRPRYLFNLATALQLRSHKGDRTDVERALEVLDEALVATEQDQSLYATRAALRAALHKQLFGITGDVTVLVRSVDEYREVVDLIPENHIDRVSHLVNLADAARLLHKTTGDPSAADDGMVVLATLRAELRRAEQPFGHVQENLAGLVISRFGGQEPASRRDQTPEIKSVPRLMQGELADVVRHFEATGDPDTLFGADVDQLVTQVRERPPDADPVAVTAGWLCWYRFLYGAGPSNGQDLDAALTLLAPALPDTSGLLPPALRAAMLDESRLGADGINAADRVLLFELENHGHPTLAFRLIDRLREGLGATRSGYLGIAHDIAYHITGDLPHLTAAITALRSALTAGADHPRRARFLEALGGTLVHLMEEHDNRDAFDEAVAVYQEAVTLPPSPESPLGGRYEALGKLLINRRSETNEEFTHLDYAIDAFQSAVDASAADDTLRVSRLVLLCNALLMRMDFTGAVEELLEVGYRCLRELPDGSDERRDVQAMVARALLRRDDDDAIEMLRSATSGPMSSPVIEMTALLELGRAEQARYQLRNELSCLDRALVSYARVLCVAGFEFSHTFIITKLGVLLRDRFAWGRRRAHLDASILLLRDAAEAGADDVERAISLDQLALSLAVRFAAARARSDLDEAIEIRQRLLEEFAPTAAPLLLADLFVQRHRRTGSRVDLDSAADVLAAARDDPEIDRAEVEESLTLVEALHATASPGSEVSQVWVLRQALESLVADVQAGVVNATQAKDSMPRIREAEGVSTVVRALCQEATRLLHENEWQEALLRARLLVAALQDVNSASALSRARAEVGVFFVDAARQALALGADPEIYAVARREGEWALDWATTHHDDVLAGTASFRLGTMHLEPYTRFRGPDEISFGQLTWLRTGRTGALDRTRHQVTMPFGPERIVKEQVLEPPRMPDARVALTTAAQHLRQAVRLRTGQSRGEACRRLSLALVALRHIGESIDERELQDVTATALQLLPDTALAERVTLVAHVPRADALAVARAVASALERDLAGYVDSADADAAVIAASRVADLLAPTEPARALDLLEKTRRLVGRDSSETYLVSLLFAEMRLIPLVRAPGWRLPDFDFSVEPDDYVRAITDNCSPDEATGRLVVCAAWVHEQLHGDDADVRLIRLGFAALDVLREQAKGVDGLRAVHQLLCALFHFCSFVRSADAGGVVGLATAVSEFWYAGLVQHAVTCVELLFGHMGEIDEDAAVNVLTHLGMAASWLVMMEQDGARLLRDIYARLLGKLITKPITEVTLSLLVSHAKGTLLREALAAGPPAIQEFGQRERDMLSAIAAAERDAAPPAVAEPEDPVLGEAFTVAWADEVQWRPVASAEGRLRNRQRAFDQHLTRLMLRARLPMPWSFQEISSIQGALDEKTVLLIHLELITSEMRAAHLLLMLTPDDLQAFITVQQEPYGDVVFPGDLTFSLAASGMEVAALRSTVQQDPGPGLADPAALDLLTKGSFAELFGCQAGEALRRLRAVGRDQLLISPAGPFYFHPVHLVNVGGVPLADEWKIAYLPNLGLLTRNEPVTLARASTLSSIGLDYRSPAHPRLPPLLESIREATACAALFGTEPVINGAATKNCVLAALRSSRYVHIAAHGEHNVDAPAFQVVHLAPGAEDDGRLFAHELLTEDLSGLELVTLSACETGLGRIDRGDNLRGIPAALLLAGVRIVVATMWPVLDQAAGYFFPNLYRELARGQDVWNSFFHAQQLTRQRFPQYRDWGAFALMGSPQK